MLEPRALGIQWPTDFYPTLLGSGLVPSGGLGSGLGLAADFTVDFTVAITVALVQEP